MTVPRTLSLGPATDHPDEPIEAMTMATMLVLLLAAALVLWMYAPARPQPVKVRRNLLQEELLAAYSRRVDR